MASSFVGCERRSCVSEESTVMLGTFLLATSGFSWLHNSWYYLGFFSLLIHLVRILWVSSFLRLLLVLLRGDDILQLSSIRVVTVSCRMWSWLGLGSRYISSWVLCRQGDLLLVHYICVFIGSFTQLLIWLVQILDFRSVFVVMIIVMT